MGMPPVLTAWQMCIQKTVSCSLLELNLAQSEEASTLGMLQVSKLS